MTRRLRQFARTCAIVAAMLAAGPSPLAQAPRPVALELILALDCSSSVSAEEYALQRDGLAAAFGHPQVVAAIEALGEGGLAIALVQWSDKGHQRPGLAWRLVAGRGDAESLAAAIAEMPRRVTGGGTAIGGALGYALAELSSNGYQGARRTIDLSGDGASNQGPTPRHLRDRAVAAGVTVNGLAILNEDRTVAAHYSDHVIGGATAFVVEAADYRDFAYAMRRKLIREIAVRPMAEAPGGAGRQGGNPG